MLFNLCDFSGYTDEEGFINEDIVGCLGLSAWQDDINYEEDLSDFWNDPLMD